MEITLEIPETVAQTLGYAPAAWPRRALEALLVDECSRGHLTRGKVAELLGLSFQEVEDLFRNCRVPYPIKTLADDVLDNAPLSKAESRRCYRQPNHEFDALEHHLASLPSPPPDAE